MWKAWHNKEFGWHSLSFQQTRPLHFQTMCSTRKYHGYSSHRGDWNFLGVGGSLGPKNLKKCIKLNWNFQRGGGRRSWKKSLPCGRYGYFLELNNILSWFFFIYIKILTSAINGEKTIFHQTWSRLPLTPLSPSCVVTNVNKCFYLKMEHCSSLPRLHLLPLKTHLCIPKIKKVEYYFTLKIKVHYNSQK